MILGTEVSDNLCSISRLAVVWRVTDFFGSTAIIKNKITSIQAKKKDVYLGERKEDVSGFSSFLLKWREFWSPVFWKEKFLSLWNIHVISFLESQEYKEVTQSCIFSINRCYHKRKFPALTQPQGSSCMDLQHLHSQLLLWFSLLHMKYILLTTAWQSSSQGGGQICSQHKALN